MPKISVIITCKARLEHLKECLKTILPQTFSDFEVIVVDYNCPEKTSEYISKAVFDYRVKTVLADVSENEWNQGAASNLGFKNSTGEYIFIVDADTLFEPDYFQKVLYMHVDGSFICGWGAHDATGCVFLSRKTFDAVNGYNENIASWGYSDIDLYNRLQKLNLEMKPFPLGISSIKHGDEIRNTFHGNKPTAETAKENIEIAHTLPMKGLYNG